MKSYGQPTATLVRGECEPLKLLEHTLNACVTCCASWDIMRTLTLFLNLRGHDFDIFEQNISLIKIKSRLGFLLI